MPKLRACTHVNTHVHTHVYMHVCNYDHSYASCDMRLHMSMHTLAYTHVYTDGCTPLSCAYAHAHPKHRFPHMATRRAAHVYMHV